MHSSESYLQFTRNIIRTNFEIADNRVLIGGNPVSSFSNQCCTPFYVYSRTVMSKKLEYLRTVYTDRFRIYYSVKANPNSSILQYFLSRNCGLEISSAGEFCRAIENGCLPENVIFAGPGKTPSELELVIQAGIGELHIESTKEAERAETIATKCGKRVSVAIRINPSSISSIGAMQMGGKPAPFGVDEEQLDTALDFILAGRMTDFTGIHIFIGTQILSHETLLAYYRKGFQLALSVSKRCGRPIKTLDFGGGLGIPYFCEETPLDLQALRTGLQDLMREMEYIPEFSETRFLIEPGRFLVGDSGIYVARVTDIKYSKGKKFVILDGGMNHHLAASGNLGQTIKRNFPIALIDKCMDDPIEEAEIVGPLCTPLDTLGRKVPLPEVEAGDLIGFFQSGAYSKTASPLQFLGHPEPCEFVV